MTSRHPPTRSRPTSSPWALAWFLLTGRLRTGAATQLPIEVAPALASWDAFVDGCRRTNPARRFASIDLAIQSLPSQSPATRIPASPPALVTMPALAGGVSRGVADTGARITGPQLSVPCAAGPAAGPPRGCSFRRGGLLPRLRVQACSCAQWRLPTRVWRHGAQVLRPVIREPMGPLARG